MTQVEGMDKMGFEDEVKKGRRFEFGNNWRSYLSLLNAERIQEAERSLKEMLDVKGLKAKSILDIGSGSGLFSLAARRLGATVRSFDYDPESVECTQKLKDRYFAGDSQWVIERGSVLDAEYLKTLGRFDIVYCWGVLHHTGNLKLALERIAGLVKEGGRLFLSVYNDQGWRSRFWRRVKRCYCSNLAGRVMVIGLFIPYFVLAGLIKDLCLGKNPFLRYLQYKKARGMSRVHDWLDWLGGYPFETAKPDEIFDFYSKRHFRLLKMKTCAGGCGCNEYVFERESASFE